MGALFIKLILSSFCFLDSRTKNHRPWFYERLPPVCFNTGKEFVPDYASLLVGDKFILDEFSYERIKSDQHFNKYSQVIDALKATERLGIVSYEEAVKPYIGLIESDVENELRRINEWADAFLELYESWDSFNEKLKIEYRWSEEELKEIDLYSDEFYEFKESLPEERRFIYEVDEILHGGMYEGLGYNCIEVMRDRVKNRDLYGADKMDDVARAYLTHMSSNIVLSQALNAHIHDWEDIRPLYDRKLSGINGISQSESFCRQNQSKEIINITFPDFRPESTASLCRILDDKRINDFRREVDLSIQNKQVIDTDYANALLRAVVEDQSKMIHGRRVIGAVAMLTSALDALMPGVNLSAKVLGELAAEKVMDNKIMKERSWFYLISQNMESKYNK